MHAVSLSIGRSEIIAEKFGAELDWGIHAGYKILDSGYWKVWVCGFLNTTIPQYPNNITLNSEL